MYDFNAYKNEIRDFYIDVEELPGPVITDCNQEELVKELKAIENNDAYFKNMVKKIY